MSKISDKKLSTGIEGLDELFYGGIHIHENENRQKGLIMLARGQHGVNKIHLAMQICEGLYNSSHDADTSNLEKIVEQNVTISKIYNQIKKDPSKIVDFFNNLLSNENEEKEKEIWDNRKKEFEENHDKWFLKYGHGLMSTVIPKKHLITEENLITEKNLKELYSEKKNEVQEVLFISINKDSQMLKNSYYDYYIQRLIKKIREAPEEVSEPESEKALRLLHSMTWKSDDQGSNLKTLQEGYGFPSITGNPNIADTKFKEDIRTGFIYYNGRTHGLHVRHQKGAEDSGDLLLCRAIIPNDYNVSIIGKDILNEDGGDVDGVTTFQKMMRKLNTLDKNHNKPKFIMIDGLSRLNEEELAQCPLNALSDKLRSMSTVSIITANEKLKPSEISTDIIVDMDIRQSERSDHQYSALKISKCLFQKNAYGWHLYKMRNAGIEVIPSIHLQMGQRFLMDDIITDAILPIDKFPYPYWLNENKSIFIDNNLDRAKEAHVKSTGSDGLMELGELKGTLLDNNSTSMNNYFKNIIKELSEKNVHCLFVSFDKNRTCFYECVKSILDGYCKSIHFFHFRPGYYHPDEILWTLHRQIKAIDVVAKKGAKDSVLSTHYTHVSLVLGDLNYIHYAYPGLSDESLLLPALATYTKKHHMKNHIYATLNPSENLLDVRGIETNDWYKKEISTILQIQRIASIFEDQRIKNNS